jgi:hypothetical protein
MTWRMEMEAIDIKTNEMIEIEDWAEEDDDDWLVDRDGDQVMPKDVIKMVPEEDTTMEVNVGMDVMGMVAHTRHPGSKLHTEMANGMKTALHTPLLGTLCTPYTLDKTTYYMECK